MEDSGGDPGHSRIARAIIMFRSAVRIAASLLLVLFANFAHAATTTVSVGFESGFVGEYSNNAHQPQSIKTFGTLQVRSATISQTTDNGQFGGSQGNDYSVTVRLRFTNGTTATFPGAVNWRDTAGSTLHGIGITMADTTVDGTSYVARPGFSRTFLLQTVGSARTYSDTSTGQTLGVVSGNAATSGLLAALNNYLNNGAASTTPSELTSIISAAETSLAADGASTTVITVALKDVNGRAITTGGHAVTLATSAGTLSAVIDNGNGTYTATLTAAASPGTATITGTLEGNAIDDTATVSFANTASISGVLRRATGAGIAGRNVRLLDSSGNELATTTTGSDGSYSFTSIAPGTYGVEFEGAGAFRAKAQSDTGTNTGNAATGIAAPAGSSLTHVDAVVIDPSGVVYSSNTARTPIAGATASLWYGGSKVSNAWLDTTLGGPNDQVTGSDGVYTFILNGTAQSGTYELRVAGPTGYNGTASTAIPPSGTYTPGLGGGLELIQPQSTAPTGSASTTYYLFFNFTVTASLATTSNGVTNNHVPLDPAGSTVFNGTNATDASNNAAYAFGYAESRTAGAVLGTVAATGGSGGAVTFSIAGGNGSGWFAIDSATGAISLTAAGVASVANDFEVAGNAHVLSVQATDGTTTATIQVTLSEQDQDDTAPVLTGPDGVAGAAASAITVNEGQVAVTTFSAGEAVTWSISGGEDAARLTIDPDSGVLSFVSAPDFEAPVDGATSGSNTYIVQISATDADGNAATLALTVTVRDIDDTAPVITGPSDGPGAAASRSTVSEGVLPVFTFTAGEPVTWSLSGTDAARFAIDAATGALGFVSAPDFEAPADADRNNRYLLQVRAVDRAGNASTQSVEIQVLDVDEIARKLAEIAAPLRAGLRAHAATGLSDMLAFNEQMMQGAGGGEGDCDTPQGKAVSGSARATQDAAQGDMRYARRLNACGQRTRILLDAGVSFSGRDGSWTSRALAALRLEQAIGETTIGIGAIGARASDRIDGFAASSITDRSAQVQVYARRRLADNLRLGAFAGYGRAWYDFALEHDGLSVDGRMTGRRVTFGGTLSGDMRIGGTLVTTDLQFSRGTEKIGDAVLAAAYGGENRSGILFGVGSLDVTRISLPFQVPFVLASDQAGRLVRLDLSTGLLCEDRSVDRSGMDCGFRSRARLNATRDGLDRASVDATYEKAGVYERVMIGLGYAHRLGANSPVELGLASQVGTVGERAGGQVMIELKVAP